jgi:hypothetical protein
MDKLIYREKKRIHEDDSDISDTIDIPRLGQPGPFKKIVLEKAGYTITTKENTIIDETHNYLLNGKFYKIVSVKESKMVFSCQHCQKPIVTHIFIL